jgi:hypothetical protein
MVRSSFKRGRSQRAVAVGDGSHYIMRRPMLLQRRVSMLYLARTVPSSTPCGFGLQIGGGNLGATSTVASSGMRVLNGNSAVRSQGCFDDVQRASHLKAPLHLHFHYMTSYRSTPTSYCFLLFPTRAPCPASPGTTTRPIHVRLHRVSSPAALYDTSSC